MEQSPSWEANRSLASQEIPRVLWKLKVHYRIHKSPPPVRSLSYSSPPPSTNQDEMAYHKRMNKAGHPIQILQCNKDSVNFLWQYY
jgi:hypothetical protein